MFDLPMKQIVLASIIASAGLVGCNSYDTTNHGNAVSLEPAHNFLGIVKTEPSSFAAPRNSSINLSTTELYSRRAVTGDRVTLLWGAITLTDY
ncbi:hypothetical protein EBR11_01580 [bacterium]|nr:hypothetical protein [bacterium]